MQEELLKCLEHVKQVPTIQTLAICIANSMCQKLTEIRKKRVKNGGRKGPLWKRREEAALGTICKIYASLLNLDIIELN